MDNKTMKLIVPRSPTSPCQTIKACLRQKRTEISLTFVSRCLCDYFGLKPGKSARKSCSTPEWKWSVLILHKYESRTAEDRDQVMFSNESMFQPFALRESLLENRKESDLKKSTLCQMTWRVTSKHGIARLYFYLFELKWMAHVITLFLKRIYNCVWLFIKVLWWFTMALHAKDPS